MAFTDHCDIFASFHEDGFNAIVGHVRRQRPSLFNYATADVAKNRELLCKAIDFHPIVSLRHNPLVTISDPLPIPGTPYGLNFAAQLADLRIDFHPEDEISLPPELGPPLKAQRFAIKLTVCGGIGCPSADSLIKLIPPPKEPGKPTEGPQPHNPLIPLPFGRLNCFCMGAFATGGIRIATYNGKPYLEPFLDGVEIVDIKPNELESNLECYMATVLRLAILPGLRILLKLAPLNLTQGATDLFPQPTNVVISPTPVSAAVPHNPAIESDLLKVFIKAEVI